MKKITFVRASDTKYGGAEVYLSRLTNELAKKKLNFNVINSKIPKFLPSWLRVVIFNFFLCIFKGEKVYFSLDRISCPDIYRAGDGVHKVFLKIIKKSRINPLHSIYIYLEKKCFNKAKLIIANSQMVKNEIIATYGINPNKISVIYNGIKIEKIKKSDAEKEIIKEFSLNKNDIVFLYVGSGFKRKGVEDFLLLLSELKFNFKAFIVGKEKEIHHYTDLAKELKIYEKVSFTGPRVDVKYFYAISDIFILPTYYEPFSNVILEAMLYKNVVFTTLQNGASEILDDKFVMSSPTDRSIVRTINKLAQNKELMQIIQNENHIRVQDFSIENNFSQTLKAINEVVN